MKIRAFIAVELPAEVRHRAVDLLRRLRHSVSDVKWVEPENLHWTLQFLGEVGELEIPAICDAVAAAAAEHEPFELEAHGAGAFPTPDRPRTLWLGAGQGREALIALQASVADHLFKLGYRAEERRFVPHLTLGRAGRNVKAATLAAELAKLTDFDGGMMFVDEITVFPSPPSRNGPLYEPLGHLPLAP